jgi:hypothetical protein
MGLASVKFEVQLTDINCGECGGTYAINERFRQQKQQNGGGWTCPYCKCNWGFFGKTEAQKLADQLKAEQERRTAALARENEERARADKAERALKMHKKRVKNGTCPCCKRTFVQLQRHMAAKHPGFAS